MAVPKRRTSHSRKGLRRAHQALKPVFTGSCPQCSADKLPHAICGNCGYYKNGYAITIED